MKKIGLICLALVLALGGLGAAYALWSEALTISGTVETGTVDIECTNAFTDDDGKVDDDTKDAGDIGDINALYDKWGDASSDDPKESVANAARYDKDVGKSTATFTGAHTGTVELFNVYPSYYTTAYFLIHNNGSIPVKIQKVEQHCDVVHWTKVGTGPWVKRDASTWYEVTPCVVKLIDFGTLNNAVPEPDEKADLAVHVTGIELGQQLDHSQTVLMDIDIHVEQGAAELANYSFDEKVLFVQWNEYVAP